MKLKDKLRKIKKNIHEKQMDKKIRKNKEDVYKVFSKSKDLLMLCSCKNCPLFNKGCKAQNYETVQFLLSKMAEYWKKEISSATIDNILHSSQQQGYIIVAKGSSMYPNIKAGDLLIMNASQEYKKGDTIGYPSDKHGESVTHRIVDKDEDFVYAKGDNGNNSSIEKVNPITISGKISRIIKKDEEPKVYEIIYKALSTI